MTLFLNLTCTFPLFWMGIPLSKSCTCFFVSFGSAEIGNHPFFLTLLKLGIAIQFGTSLALPFLVLICMTIASSTASTYSVVITTI